MGRSEGSSTKGGITFVVKNCGASGVLNLKVTYSNPPIELFETLTNEFGPLQLAAWARLGAKRQIRRGIRYFRKVMVAFP